MNLASFSKACLAVLGIVASANVALIESAQAQFTSIHKWTNPGTQKTYVYFPGLSTGQTLEVTSPGVATTKLITLDNCGVGKFKESTTSPVVNITGSSVNFASIATGAAPTCTKDSTTGTYTSSIAASPVGFGVKTAEGYYYIKGGSTIGSATLEVTTMKTITVKGSDCGWGRATVSTTRPFTEFTANGTDYTLAALPAATNPQVCRSPYTGATAKVNYVPAAGF